MNYIKQEKELLVSFKVENYTYGPGVLNEIGALAASQGKNACRFGILSQAAKFLLKPSARL